jgi:hypothetical protein
VADLVPVGTDYARNEILAEVIAFANAQGGSVVLESRRRRISRHARMPSRHYHASGIWRAASKIRRAHASIPRYRAC